MLRDKSALTRARKTAKDHVSKRHNLSLLGSEGKGDSRRSSGYHFIMLFRTYPYSCLILFSGNMYVRVCMYV